MSNVYVALTREQVARTYVADTGHPNGTQTVSVDLDDAGRVVGIAVEGAVRVAVDGSLTTRPEHR